MSGTPRECHASQQGQRKSPTECIVSRRVIAGRSPNDHFGSDSSWKRSLILHMAFLESLADHESSGDKSSWSESLAGFLVLRLCDLWGIDSAVAANGSKSAEAVRSLVGALPEACQSRTLLERILDALGDPKPAGLSVLASRIGAYAELVGSASSSRLAADVRLTVRRLPPVRP